jgi:hypothetical protein
MLPLRHLLGLTLSPNLALKEINLSENAFGILTSRG